MDERKNVLIINVHGGFPSCMIQKAFEQLPTLKDIKQRSDFYTRAYPTNAAAGPSLHDIIMDAPLGSMIDSVWHEWAQVRKPSRTMFHVFKQHGYTTNMFGAFGLDKKLDPHHNMHTFPGEVTKSLNFFGIDDFESQDAAFTCQMAFAHDKDVICRACNFFDQRSKDLHNITMINLLGCADIHKCAFDDCVETPIVPVVPIEHFDIWSQRGLLDDIKPTEDDVRRYAESVCNDNPRNAGSASSNISALMRASMLYDHIRGMTAENSMCDGLRVASEMHRFAWKYLIEFDKNLARLFRVLKSRKYLADTIIYIMSDHPVSLFEHGQVCETPWDSCLHTFLLVHQPNQVSSRCIDQPYTLAHLPVKIMNECGIFADWHVKLCESSVLTAGLCPSWLSRALLEPKTSIVHFRVFFFRTVTSRHGRIYSIVVWFSMHDLLIASAQQTENLNEYELLVLCTHTLEWENPVLDRAFERLDVQVYDLTTDPFERDNLMGPLWAQTKSAKGLQEEFERTVIDAGFKRLLLKFPSHIHDVHPERITFCSVQSYTDSRLLRRPFKSTVASKGTQTDVATLSRESKKDLDEDTFRALTLKMQQHKQVPLTMFSNSDKQHSLPFLFGIFSLEVLTNLARKGVELVGDGHQRLRFKLDGDSHVRLETQGKTFTIITHGVFLHHADSSCMVFFVTETRGAHLNLSSINETVMLAATDEQVHHDEIARADSPKSERSNTSDRSRKLRSRHDLTGSRAASTKKIQPNVTAHSKGSVKTAELGRLQQENRR